MSLKYSETFYSAQGEGQYVGIPSLWMRFFLCNLQCNGFGQKDPTDPSTYDLPYEKLDIFYNQTDFDFSKQYIQISLFPDDETKDEFWIGDKNLYAITRYNPSSKYAMSVFLLSEELKITSDL